MPADISQSIKDWSATPGSNLPTGGTLVGGNLDDNLRAIQAALRADCATRASIASAATTDIGSVDAGSLDVTGSTTITSFGTVSAGIRKRLVFSGSLTLTHNATSLILPNGGSNIVTAPGDVAVAESLGSGNWRVLLYQRANGNNVANATTFGDGSASAPSITFAADTDTGFYRNGANTFGAAAGGIQAMSIAANNVTIPVALNVSGAVTADLGTTGGGTSNSILLKAQDNTSGSTDGGSVTIQTGGAGSSFYGGDIALKPGANASTPDRSGRVNFWNSATNTPALRVTGYGGHLCVVDGDSGGGGVNKPTITSGGGSSPTLVGSDNAFKITLGTSPGNTPIALTFAKPFKSPPIAIAQYQSANIALQAQTTATSITITPAATMTAGHVIDVIVIGREAN
jgi:hypothetical protein